MLGTCKQHVNSYMLNVQTNKNLPSNINHTSNETCWKHAKMCANMCLKKHVSNV